MNSFFQQHDFMNQDSHSLFSHQAYMRMRMGMSMGVGMGMGMGVGMGRMEPTGMHHHQPVPSSSSCLLHSANRSEAVVSPAHDHDASDAPVIRHQDGKPRPLPHLQEPGKYDVICARGSRAANHAGNLRFRNLIREQLPHYNLATNKLEKSLIVTSIVDSVRNYSPDGGFIKQDKSGKWYDVGDALAREKIGQTIRDQLHSKYKSSTKSKKQRRKQLEEKPTVDPAPVSSAASVVDRLPPPPEDPPSSTDATDDDTITTTPSIGPAPSKGTKGRPRDCMASRIGSGPLSPSYMKHGDYTGLASLLLEPIGDTPVWLD